MGGWATPATNTTLKPGTAQWGPTQIKKPVAPARSSSVQSMPTAVQSAPSVVRAPSSVVQSAPSGGGANPMAAALATLAAPRAAAPMAAAAAPTTNVARADPNVDAMVAAYKARLAKVQQRPALDPSYTQRAVSSARGEIMDTGAGMQEGLSARLAAQGRLGGGSETSARSRIGEAATRASNKAASDISISRVRDEENNALARDAQENAFTLGGAAIAAAPAGLALQQQGLGLQQQLGTGQLALQQQQQEDQRTATLLALMRSGGYSPF